VKESPLLTWLKVLIVVVIIIGLFAAFRYSDLSSTLRDGRGHGNLDALRNDLLDCLDCGGRPPGDLVYSESRRRWNQQDRGVRPGNLKETVCQWGNLKRRV